LSSDIITSISATVGGGFFGGLLFGYAIKKVVQYQQIASFDWNRIEALAIAALGNVTALISTNQEELATLAMSNFGIPLSGSMSAGFAVGFMKG
jgi:uncharacterized membrane protein (Fun14 family)